MLVKLIEIIAQREGATHRMKDATYFPSTKTLYSNYEVSPKKWPHNKLQLFSPYSLKRNTFQQ